MDASASKSRVQRQMDEVLPLVQYFARSGHDVEHQHGPAPEWTIAAFKDFRLATRDPTLFGSDVGSWHVDLAARYSEAIKTVIVETLSRTRNEIGLVMLSRQVAQLQQRVTRQEEWRQEMVSRLSEMESVVRHATRPAILPTLEQLVDAHPGLGPAIAAIGDAAKRLFGSGTALRRPRIDYDPVLGGVVIDVEVLVTSLGRDEYRRLRKQFDKAVRSDIDPVVLPMLVVTTVLDG